MVDLQRDVFYAAVNAFPTPFFQQIFPHFLPSQRALLVFGAGDFGIYDSVLQNVRVSLDPGSKTTGIAVTREAETVDPGTGEIVLTRVVRLLLELHHRGQVIRDALALRRGCRRQRRSHLRYRPARFNNRAKPKGWLAPSLQHRADTTMAWAFGPRDRVIPRVGAI